MRPEISLYGRNFSCIEDLFRKMNAVMRAIQSDFSSLCEGKRNVDEHYILVTRNVFLPLKLLYDDIVEFFHRCPPKNFSLLRKKANENLENVILFSIENFSFLRLLNEKYKRLQANFVKNSSVSFEKICYDLVEILVIVEFGMEKFSHVKKNV